MTNKNLTILGVIAAVMIVLVIWQSGTDKTTTADNDAIKYLIQGLDPSVLETIEVVGSGDDNTVTLVKTDDGFVVKELSGYPAKMSEINNLITKSIDIKVGKVYTSDPDNFDDLGVSEENAKTIVRFKGADDKLITGVAVSEYKDGKSYVRRIDADDVYQAQDSVWLNSSAQSYVDKQLTSVKKEDIAEVKVNSGAGGYTLSGDEGKASMQDVPEGKQVKQAEVDKVFKAITSLRFDDVKKAGEVNVNLASSYVCKLNNSTVYTIKLAKKDDKTYASLSAEFTDTTPVMKEKGVESEEELKKKEAKLLAHEAAKEFDEKHKGWVYILPSYQADNLMIERDAILEDTPEPEPQAEPAAAEPEVKVQQQAENTPEQPAVEESATEAQPAAEPEPQQTEEKTAE
jgi:hypothetical protein